MSAAEPFKEPSTAVVLSLGGFLLLLNVVGAVVDRWLHCGLLAQIGIGLIWGMPVAGLLHRDIEQSFAQLGFLGLILLVYEGGLSAELKLLKQSLLLSVAVAVTGVILPIGLSFVLIPLLGATPLQGFAAGAALCSTSLGTVFTILTANGLLKTREGAVIATAAMLDDIAGLIMVQIVSSLGRSAGQGPAPAAIIRPVVVSVASAGVLYAIAELALLIVLTILLFAIILPNRMRYVPVMKHVKAFEPWVKVSWNEVVFLTQISMLFALTAGVAYAGGSILLGAYLAGILTQVFTVHQDDGSAGLATYEKYMAAPVNRLLKPLFFASIGFAIPVRAMFGRTVVWQGFVYTLMMALVKMACGLWLVRRKRCNSETFRGSSVSGVKQHISNYFSSALLVGSAMISRGEIGFLIASIAQADGIFNKAPVEGDASAQSDLFLVVIWAITLCTAIGPILVSLLSRNRAKHQLEISRWSGRRS